MANYPMEVREHIHTMLGNPVHNYAIAGLKSELLVEGTVRLFTQETVQLSMITPHSHRYNLGCIVMKGEVQNTIWKEAEPDYDGPTHLMGVSKQIYLDMGEYELEFQRQARFRTEKHFHRLGEYYFMEATQIHSIYFEAGSEVLLFEGPPKFEFSVILEPMGEDGPIPIHETLPWMFK